MIQAIIFIVAWILLGGFFGLKILGKYRNNNEIKIDYTQSAGAKFLGSGEVLILVEDGLEVTSSFDDTEKPISTITFHVSKKRE